MRSTEKVQRRIHVPILGAVACLVMTAAVLAGGGNVLPPTAKAKGYSLAEAAAATAYFNTGPRTPETLPRDFPFEILYFGPRPDGTTFTVRPGSMLYVPLTFSDSTDSALWPFPDVEDPEAVSDYYFDPLQLGAEFAQVIVDGQVTELGPGYAVGAVTPGLPTGGNSYTVIAAVLTPLSKGTHTVTIRSRFSGAFIAMYPDMFPGGVFGSEFTYTVIVK
jgi:hypothetical protein